MVAAGGVSRYKRINGVLTCGHAAVVPGRTAMSRAFVKEGDEDSGDELPQRPVPRHANYVTPRGLEQLRARARELADRHERLKAESADDSEAKHRLREVERDQRYVLAQLERAELVDPAQHPADEVRFGATVTVEDEGGHRETYAIVGDDEAEVAAGRISWATPLARSLLGARVGDRVRCHRPAGERVVGIIAVNYNN